MVVSLTVTRVGVCAKTTIYLGRASRQAALRSPSGQGLSVLWPPSHLESWEYTFIHVSHILPETRAFLLLTNNEERPFWVLNLTFCDVWGAATSEWHLCQLLPVWRKYPQRKAEVKMLRLTSSPKQIALLDSRVWQNAFNCYWILTHICFRSVPWAHLTSETHEHILKPVILWLVLQMLPEFEERIL